MLSTKHQWVAALVAGSVATPLWAADRDWLTIEGDYLIGASVVSGNGHVGDAPVSRDFKPMWAFQLGPFRVSRSRAASLMQAGREKLETGVSADFGIFEDWRASVSLRVDNGRDFGDDPRYAGLPDVRSTLRWRVSTGFSFGDNWSWSSSYDRDFLGRNGGSRLSAGLNYRYPINEMRYWDLGVGTTWGDRTYLQTTYGITPQTAAATGRAPYRLGSGLENLRLGAQYTHVLSDHWVLFGGLDLSRMVSAPAGSPLVGRKTTHTLSAGIAFRGKR
ncbi:MipA/OmpV family protein [Hydrogenophaga sp.]|uniref:MipA/OmpV family protein n=1 Tax=Hydrogenophaga sp. TaxID=1904254 RepID=UPI0035B13118